MKPINWRAIAGIGLLLFGGLLLLQTLNILPQGGWMWAIPFILGGVAFLSVLSRGRQNWWAAIPGVTLISLGALVAVNELAPAFGNRYGGSIFLFGLSLAFLIVYLMNQRFWWAIIPMGVMATLAAVTILEEATAFEGGAVFFLGLAFTFALVAILPNGGERMRWPWIPALALLVLGSLLSIGAENLMVYIFPGALILVGIYLLFGAARRS